MEKSLSWITISFYCRISILLTVLAIIGTTSPAQAQMRHVGPNAPSNVQLPNYADLVSELEAQKARIAALEVAAKSSSDGDDDEGCGSGCCFFSDGKFKWKCGKRPGEITFKPGLRIQGRYLYDDSSHNHDFFIRRFRLKGSGEIFDVATYGSELKIDSTKKFGGAVDPTPVVENAWIDFHICENMFLHVGLYDIPFSRNALTSDSKLLFMDRTLIKAELTTEGLADNTIGLMLHGRPLGGYFEYSVGVFDNARYELSAGGTRQSNDLMSAGRMVWYLLDPAPQTKGVIALSNGYADYKGSYVGEGERLALGANYAYLGDASDVAVGPNDFDLFAWGVDILYNSGPWVFQAEYDWFKQDRTGGLSDLTGEGWYVQGGYLLGCCCKCAFELAARYQELNPEDDAEEKLRWTSIGMNIYIHDHNLKIQMDYTFKNEKRNEIDNDVLQMQLQLDF